MTSTAVSPLPGLAADAGGAASGGAVSGGLAGPVTLENLGQKRYSRNPLLARLMYELRLVEEMGTGIRRMRRALAEIGSPPPRFETDATSFIAVLPVRPQPAHGTTACFSAAT